MATNSIRFQLGWMDSPPRAPLSVKSRQVSPQEIACERARIGDCREEALGPNVCPIVTHNEEPWKQPLHYVDTPPGGF